MGYVYETINGQRVEWHVAAAFRKLAADFEAETGYDLLVTEGVRTRARQLYYYNGWVARKPGFNLALHPDDPKAYHVETNPHGPRALDLHDSGKDAGVTVIGTHRSDVLARLAPKHGFEPAGHHFNPREGWHYEYTGKVGGPKPAPAPKPAAKPTTPPRIVRLGSKGDLVRKVQKKLKTVYPLYAGKLAVDGIAGKATIAAIREFQRRAGLKVDGIAGVQTLKRLGV